MDIRPIKTEKDHDWALKEIQRLWSAKPGSAEEDRMMVLVTLVEAFEGEHYAMDLPDPIEAIKFRMEQQGLSRADLEPMIGSRGRVSEIMNRSRSLTMAMIRKLHAALNIPAEILIRETALPPLSFGTRTHAISGAFLACKRKQSTTGRQSRPQAVRK
jgi:HTH-type transcriptional regulator/antitoxin HigA